MFFIIFIVLLNPLVLNIFIKFLDMEVGRAGLKALSSQEACAKRGGVARTIKINWKIFKLKIYTIT